MLVLGIDTSCDETAVSIVENSRKVLSSVVFSSLKLHKKFGGVVPEIASRAHLEKVIYVIHQALEQAEAGLEDIGLIAVTYGPGLVGSLLVGISVAKSFSLSHKLQLVGINHLEAHLEANFIGKRIPRSPFIGLVVSGGHTSLVYNRKGRYQLLGRTRDDAAGEAFDKVARILGLGYPGGPVIERLSRKGDPQKIKFPRCFLKKDSLDFSFSGIKTSVLYYVRDHVDRSALCVVRRASGKIKRDFEEKRNFKTLERTTHDAQRTAQIADIAAGFQEAVVDTLTAKAISACKTKRVDKMAVGGGVAANLRFRKKLTAEADKSGIKICWPEKEFCTDNAAMVASLGYRQYKKGKRFDLSLTAMPSLEFGGG
ncbi:MAG: tRNA (adenosine(37)-N6)-threonylcarbamoyltransferase complex transferase subunit TsaD [Candidatus Omnitrophota bacterium]|nr:tRNA (adenosine(37)-N6)-threonylcarbamoyltransferase complex transferase subunit TsaD [Candidatus Omnitrophota bacterium]